MNFKKKFSMAAESLAAVCIAAILVAACGGGNAGPIPVYIASAGVGEVLQFSMDGGNMIYSYAVVETSYAASGVTPGNTSSGTLLALNADGSYNLGPTLDGFIQGGKLFPVLGQLAGHINLATFPGASIPVFGVINPTPTLITLNGAYDYQGFSCNAAGIANAASAVPGACVAQYGTMTIAAINPINVNQTSASYTTCNGGDITSQSIHPCTLSSGTMESTGTPGVYNMFDSNSHHVGWFFASYAPNGQIVGVIDHDDQYTPAYGHSVLTTYAGLVLGTGDGSYYINDNEGKENRVSIFTTAAYNSSMTQIIYTTNYTSTANPGAQGTLTLNTPWNGMSTYYIPASGVIPAASGVAMVSATGAYTHTSLQDAALFATGAK